MKKSFRKRVLSAILAFTIAISCVPAYAVNYDVKEGSSVTFQSCGNGLYQISNPSPINLHTRGTVIHATATKNSDIFHVSSNNYLVLSHDSSYVLTEKISVDINSFSPKNYPKIPFEVLDGLQKDIETQFSRGNMDFTAAIYSPVAENTYVSDSTLSNRAYWGSQYTCGPYTLKDYFVELGNANTGMVEKKGTNTNTWAKSLFNLIISAGGTVSTTISLFGVGISAFDFFVSLFGKVERTNTKDYISVDTVYNKIGKSTYVLDGDMWLFSLGTQKATITQVNVYQFYADNGNTSYKNTMPNKVHKTENYDNPNMAIQMMGVGYMDPNIRYTVFDTTYAL